MRLFRTPARGPALSGRRGPAPRRLLSLPLVACFLLLAAAFAGCSLAEDKSDAEAAVTAFYEAVDRGDYASAMIVPITEDPEQLGRFFSRFGRSLERKQTGFQVMRGTNAHVALQFGNRYERGDVTENFYLERRDGEMRVVGWNFSSNDPGLLFGPTN